MGACFNVTIECQANYMVANVAANRMFDGKVGLPKSSNDDSPIYLMGTGCPIWSKSWIWLTWIWMFYHVA